MLGGLFGAKESIDATSGLVDSAGKALNNLFTSDDERLSRAEMMARIQQKPDEWIHQLNVINAKSSNWFNSGWRPAFGWVLAISAACFFIPKFLITSVIWAKLSIDTGIIQPYPITAGELLSLAGMMFGSQVVRQYDKLKGTAKS